MPDNPNTRRRTVRGDAIVFIFSAMAFAAPALAETVTLSCEGDLTTGMNQTGPGNWTIDVDYTAGTVTWGGNPVISPASHPAVVNDRMVAFEVRNASLVFTGRIDRLAGTIDVFISTVRSNGFVDNSIIRARCRPATQRF